MTTSNIYGLGSNYGHSMSTNQLFPLNFALGKIHLKNPTPISELSKNALYEIT